MQVLSGVKVVFSGVFPSSMPLHKAREVQMAQKLGAQCYDKVGPHITHIVVFLRNGRRHLTDKLLLCLAMGTVEVVSPNWLQACSAFWERAQEDLFRLPDFPLVLEENQKQIEERRQKLKAEPLSEEGEAVGEQGQQETAGREGGEGEEPERKRRREGGGGAEGEEGKSMVVDIDDELAELEEEAEAEEAEAEKGEEEKRKRKSKEEEQKEGSEDEKEVAGEGGEGSDDGGLEKDFEMAMDEEEEG